MLVHFTSVPNMSKNMTKMFEMEKTLLPTSIKNNILYKALLTRRVEEKLLELYNLGELHGTIHTCIGQEFTGAVLSEFIRKDDAVFSNHRCHGHFLSLTQDIDGLIAEIYGHPSGVCGGKGGSQHLHKNNFYSNGIQGGIIPVAAGISMGKKLKNKQNVCFVFIGDGTLGEGILYETLNMISKWQLPLIVVLENNLYAQSTSQKEVMAGNICARAEAFSIKTGQACTWDFARLYWTVEELVTYTRSTFSPCFLQIDTYRLAAHSKGDDIRDPNEIDYYKSIDPLNILLDTDSVCQQMDEQIHHLISQAISAVHSPKVLNTTFPTLTPLQWSNESKALSSNNTLRLSILLNDTFKELMEENKNIYFIGEDVRSPYGGAFKISKELSTLFPERVLNTPISEGAIVGLANGLALEGYIPIVEIMFGDFITLTLDQIINHAAKFRYMYNNQVRVPIIIRTPMGGGRGYGPTHSQTLDRHLLGIPGIRVMAINNLIHPKILYETIIRSSEDPTIVLENKVLYVKPMRNTPSAGFTSSFIPGSSPLVIVAPESTTPIDLTIVAYGGMSDTVLDVLATLFLEHDLVAQFICPLQIYPFDIRACETIIHRSTRMALIEEGQGYANFSSEFLAQYMSHYASREMKFKRIASEPSAIPSSKQLEDSVLINKTQIIDSIIAFLSIS